MLTCQVLDWLLREDADAPRLITLYLEEPDFSATRYGPDSPEAHEAVSFAYFPTLSKGSLEREKISSVIDSGA